MSVLKRLDDNGVVLVTSTDVLGETLTVISRKLGKSMAREFYDSFVLGSAMKILLVGDMVQSEAINLFFRARSKKVSYIDCSSVVMMKQNKIELAFTFDRHFKQLGVKLVRG